MCHVQMWDHSPSPRGLPMCRCTMIGLAISFVLPGLAISGQGEKGDGKVPAALNFKMTGLDGKEIDLSAFTGKVVLFVNVASECGFTPQYEPLQALHAKLAKEGLVIVGVPCNQ